MSTRIQRSALLFYSAEQMYDLVNDVAAYPQFVEHCVGTEIIEQSDTHMLARLQLKKAGVEFALTTRNQLQRPNHIVLQLEDGPFSFFKGEWLFTPLRDSASKVELTIEYTANQSLVAKLAGGLLESLSQSLVDTFCRRAVAIYGEQSGDAPPIKTVAASNPVQASQSKPLDNQEQ